MSKMLCLILLALSYLCDGYKILVVFPVATRSHNILGVGYVRHLLDAGHEVTYVTPYPTNKTNEKYHEVDISKNIEDVNDTMSMILTLKAIINKEAAVNPISLLSTLIPIAKLNLNNRNLVKFLSDTTQEFDAVIVEWAMTEIYAGLAYLSNCPLIWSSSIEPHWMVLQLLHEPSNPSVNPDPFLTTIPPFTFFQRMKNLFAMLVFTCIRNFYLLPQGTSLYEEYYTPLFALRSRQVLPYDDAVISGSFLLANSHPSVSQPTNVPANVKEIGGYHIDSNIMPLSADLKKLMDEAKHGVIYFSMGTLVKSNDWPEDLKRDFLEVFGALKQTVLWKFEGELPNLPKNVHILKWAPQPSILAHPNLRLFITHGGLLSTTETVYFGVPIIVMPYGADQHINALRAVNKGYAKIVELSYEMAGEMKLAIDGLLENSSYTEKVKQLSEMYHDRPVPAGKELVHWVEHVVRTRGAPHLRSPALLLPWYQKLYIDLLAFVLITLYVIKLLFKLLYRLGKSLLIKRELLAAPLYEKKSN